MAFVYRRSPPKSSAGPEKSLRKLRDYPGVCKTFVTALRSVTVDDDRPPTLSVRSTPPLRRHGIKGRVAVSFEADHLVLIGARGGQLLVAPSGIIRLRSGIDRRSRNGPWFSSSVWLHAKPQEIRLTSNRFDMAAYRVVFGGLAAAMAAEDGLARLEIGRARPEARIAIGALAALALGALWAGIWALPAEGWWLRITPALAPVLLIGLVVLLARRNRPRQPQTLAEYLQQLEYPKARLQLGWRRRAVER